MLNGADVTDPRPQITCHSSRRPGSTDASPLDAPRIPRARPRPRSPRGRRRTSRGARVRNPPRERGDRRRVISPLAKSVTSWPSAGLKCRRVPTTTSDGSHERLPANQPRVAGVIRTFQPPRPPTRRRDDPRGDESGTSRGHFPRLAGIFPRDVRGRRAAVDDGARHDGIRLGRYRGGPRRGRRAHQGS